MSRAFLSVLLFTLGLLSSRCFAQTPLTGTIYGEITPTLSCSSGACRPVLDKSQGKVFGYFSSVTSTEQGLSSVLSGVCTGSCSAPGKLPNVGVWTFKSSAGQMPRPGAAGVVSITGVFNARIPLPAAVGAAATNIVDYVKQTDLANKYGDAIKNYYSEQRDRERNDVARLRSEVAAFQENSARVSFDSMAALSSVASTLPVGSANDRKALESFNDYLRTREDPFVTKHNEFDSSTARLTTDDLAHRINARQYDAAANDIDELANSNHAMDLATVPNLKVRDGVADFGAFDTVVPRSPLAGSRFRTPVTRTGGQELRRVANSYQAFWATTRGLINYSENSVTQYAAGILFLREADRSFSVRSSVDEGFGYLRLSKVMLDIARGARDGVGESLFETITLLPHIAGAVRPYVEAIYDDPREVFRLSEQIILSIPTFANGLVEEFKQKADIIQNGSAYERSRLISKVATDFFIADVTGGLAVGAEVKSATIADEVLAKEATVSVGSTVAKAQAGSFSEEVTAELAQPLVEEGRQLAAPVYKEAQLSHMFQAKHGLQGVLEAAGTREAAAAAIEKAATDLCTQKQITYLFKEQVEVYGIKVQAWGRMIDGRARIATAFIPGMNE